MISYWNLFRNVIFKGYTDAEFKAFLDGNGLKPEDVNDHVPVKRIYNSKLQKTVIECKTFDELINGSDDDLRSKINE
jgi:hypothetical protein